MAHPLLLPNVLRYVFSHFTPEQLKEYRLINLDWNHAACTSIANQTTIDFDSPESLESYQSIFISTSTVPHSAFSFHYKTSEQEFSRILNFVRSRNSTIRALHVTLGSGFLTIENLRNLLEELCNLEVLGLGLHYFRVTELEEDDMEYDLTFPILQSLRTLIIEVQNMDYSSYSAMKLLVPIIQASPNLSQIQHPRFILPPSKCRIPARMNVFLTDLILDEPLSSPSSDSLSKLYQLNFIMKMSSENIRRLIGKRCPLKQVYMNLWCHENEELCVTPATLRSLMAGLSPSLEMLGLDLPWRREVAYESMFPMTMRKLSYLSLIGYQGMLISPLEKLPFLKYLELSQIDLAEILPSTMQINRSFPSVEKLRIDFCTHQYPGSISRLSRLFTNLRALDINHMTDDVCRMIFKKMNNLEYLRLHGDDLTDEGVTGIPLEDIKENKLAKCPIEKGDELRSFTFIGHLPKLKRLKLDAYHLTEASIRHGLVHCVTLQFVSMDTRADKSDPHTTVTRTFRLSEYGQQRPSSSTDDKDGIVFLREETEVDEDEDAVKFFQTYETGVTDLILAT